MDEETVERMRSAAEESGLSMSAWLARLVRERTRTEWPPEVVALAGAWKDFPSADEIRQTSGADVRRRKL